jgi:hypothetical protein
LCAPAHCARTLLHPRPEGAIRVGAPRRSRDAAPPSPQRGSRVRYPRASEGFATRGTGDSNPHPLARSTEATAKVTLCHNLSRVSLESGEGGGQIRPAGDMSHSAGACGTRAARPVGGDAGPERASHARKGNSEGPLAGLCPAAGGIARDGESEGCARCAARATAQSPRGKEKPGTECAKAPTCGNGTTKPSRSDRHETGREHEGQEKARLQTRGRDYFW